MMEMLDTLDTWIDDIPPLSTPQRFGNLAFRTWGNRLEQNISTFLKTFLPQQYHPTIPHLSPYLLTSFGSFTRMDYGTGHELSFALFLCCLSLLRFFPFPVVRQQPFTTSPPRDSDSGPSNHTAGDRQEEQNDQDRTLTLTLARSLALTIFPRYLRLTWRLQDTYDLEPAGSHGVWGLDDSSFLGYIWGSGQLRDSSISPTSILARAPLPQTNLYNLLINRIHQVKHGPFHEHSSQLYSIATGVKNWGKVNSGLFKMYEAEVLGKRVVVQHIPLGGLLKWDVQPSSTLSHTSPKPQQTWTSTPSTSIDSNQDRPKRQTNAPWDMNAATIPADRELGGISTRVPSWSTALPTSISSSSGYGAGSMGPPPPPRLPTMNMRQELGGSTRAPWASGASPSTTTSLFPVPTPPRRATDHSGTSDSRRQ